MFQDVLKPFHLQPLKQTLRKRMFWKKICPNMMKRRKDFSSKSGVKFRFISKLAITFSVGGVWVYFWHNLLCLNDPADIYFNILSFKDFVQADAYLGCLWSLRWSSL